MCISQNIENAKSLQRTGPTQKKSGSKELRKHKDIENQLPTITSIIVDILIISKLKYDKSLKFRTVHPLTILYGIV